MLSHEIAPDLNSYLKCRGNVDPEKTKRLCEKGAPVDTEIDGF